MINMLIIPFFYQMSIQYWLFFHFCYNTQKGVSERAFGVQNGNLSVDLPHFGIMHKETQDAKKFMVDTLQIHKGMI